MRTSAECGKWLKILSVERRARLSSGCELRFVRFFSEHDMRLVSLDLEHDSRFALKLKLVKSLCLWLGFGTWFETCVPWCGTWSWICLFLFFTILSLLDPCHISLLWSWVGLWLFRLGSILSLVGQYVWTLYETCPGLLGIWDSSVPVLYSTGGFSCLYLRFDLRLVRLCLGTYLEHDLSVFTWNLRSKLFNLRLILQTCDLPRVCPCSYPVLVLL